MDKKVFKLLYTLIMKDVEIAALQSNAEATTKAVADLKAKITESFKMVSELNSTES